MCDDTVHKILFLALNLSLGRIACDCRFSLYLLNGLTKCSALLFFGITDNDNHITIIMHWGRIEYSELWFDWKRLPVWMVNLGEEGAGRDREANNKAIACLLNLRRQHIYLWIRNFVVVALWMIYLSTAHACACVSVHIQSIMMCARFLICHHML